MDPSHNANPNTNDDRYFSNPRFGMSSNEAGYYNEQNYDYPNYGQEQQQSSNFCGRLAQKTSVAPWARASIATATAAPQNVYDPNNVDSYHSQSQHMALQENVAAFSNTAKTFKWHAEYSNGVNSTSRRLLPSLDPRHQEEPKLPWYQNKARKRRKRHTLPGPAGVLPASSQRKKASRSKNNEDERKNLENENDHRSGSESESDDDEQRDNNTWGSKMRKHKKLRCSEETKDQQCYYENMQYWQRCIFNHPAWWKMCSSLERYIPAITPTLPPQTNSAASPSSPQSSLRSLRDVVSLEYTLLSQVFSQNLITVPLMAVLMTINPIDLTKEGGGNIRSSASSYFTLTGSVQDGESLILCHVMDDSSLTSGIIATGWVEESIFNDDFERCHSRTKHSSGGLSKNQRQHGVIVVLLKDVPLMVLPRGNKDDDDSYSNEQGAGESSSSFGQGAADIDRVLLISSDHVICRWTNESDNTLGDDEDDNTTHDEFSDVDVTTEQRRRFDRFLSQGREGQTMQENKKTSELLKNNGAATETSSLKVILEHPRNTDTSFLSGGVCDEENACSSSTIHQKADSQAGRDGAETIRLNERLEILQSPVHISVTTGASVPSRNDDLTLDNIQPKQFLLPKNGPCQPDAVEPRTDDSLVATNENAQPNSQDRTSCDTEFHNPMHTSPHPNNAQTNFISTPHIEEIQQMPAVAPYMEVISTDQAPLELTLPQEQHNSFSNPLSFDKDKQFCNNREPTQINKIANNSTISNSSMHQRKVATQEEEIRSSNQDFEDDTILPPVEANLGLENGVSRSPAPSIWKGLEEMQQDDVPGLSCTPALGQSKSSDEEVEAKNEHETVGQEESNALFSTAPSIGLFSMANDTPLEDFELDDDLSLDD